LPKGSDEAISINCTLYPNPVHAGGGRRLVYPEHIPPRQARGQCKLHEGKHLGWWGRPSPVSRGFLSVHPEARCGGAGGGLKTLNSKLTTILKPLPPEEVARRRAEQEPSQVRLPAMPRNDSSKKPPTMAIHSGMGAGMGKITTACLGRSTARRRPGQYGPRSADGRGVLVPVTLARATKNRPPMMPPMRYTSRSAASPKAGERNCRRKLW
jgi:hypothetical protein